ncbi:hypothetical protein ACFLT7_00005 [candidate division KSB1 bacterium]
MMIPLMLGLVAGGVLYAAPAIESGDGLRLEYAASGTMDGISIKGSSIRTTGRVSFQVMEVTDGVEGAEFVPMKTEGFEDNSDSLLIKTVGDNLVLTTVVKTSPNGLRFRADLESSVRRERSLVLRWVLPVEAGGWSWQGGLGKGSPIAMLAGSERYEEVTEATVRTSENGGLNTEKTGGIGSGTYGEAVGMGTFSPYPLACVVSKKTGIGIGVDIDHPVFYRLAYIPGEGLAVEFDLGLSPGTLKFPNRAELSWVVFGVDPQWGFRSAIAQYYALFPEAFKKRVTREGIWMPFTDITTVKDHEDFGFAFHETSLGRRRDGVETIADVDRKIGVYSFHYVEPWDIQIAAQKDGLAYDAAVAADYPPEPQRAQILRSVAFDPYQQWMVRVMYAPWFKTEWALSYTTNPDPELGPGSRYASVRERAVDPALEAGFDGIYFDSWEFFWPFDLNYRQDHFNTADYPLCFSSAQAKPRPAVWHYSSEYEMGKDIADELHYKNKLTMGNGFYRIPFTAGIMDLFGCEFQWPGREERRVSRWAYFRTMAAGKPIVVLLNHGMYSDAFQKEPYPGYGIYFQEALFWGIYPSFFSPDAARNPYWRNPEAYEKGRPFFKRYIPLITEVASAGWNPIPAARTSPEQVRVERFGPNSDGAVYFTLRDLGGEHSGPVELVMESDLLPDSGKTGFREIVAGDKLASRGEGDGITVTVTLKQGETRVVRVGAEVEK